MGVLHLILATTGHIQSTSALAQCCLGSSPPLDRRETRIAELTQDLSVCNTPALRGGSLFITQAGSPPAAAGRKKKYVLKSENKKFSFWGLSCYKEGLAAHYLFGGRGGAPRAGVFQVHLQIKSPRKSRETSAPPCPSSPANTCRPHPLEACLWQVVMCIGHDPGQASDAALRACLSPSGAPRSLFEAPFLWPDIKRRMSTRKFLFFGLTSRDACPLGN